MLRTSQGQERWRRPSNVRTGAHPPGWLLDRDRLPGRCSTGLRASSPAWGCCDAERDPEGGGTGQRSPLARVNGSTVSRRLHCSVARGPTSPRCTEGCTCAFPGPPHNSARAVASTQGSCWTTGPGQAGQTHRIGAGLGDPGSPGTRDRRTGRYPRGSLVTESYSAGSRRVTMPVHAGSPPDYRA